MDVLDSLRELIALAFDVPRETVTERTVQADIPAWDSVGHLNLMLMLEDHFKVRLDVADMVKLTSVQAILDWLAGGQLGVRPAELATDLFRGVTFAFHRESPPPGAATPPPGNRLS